MPTDDVEPITRRMYLQVRAMEHGASWMVAREAVASTALEHPEWDMDERDTLAGWRRRLP